MPHKDPKVAQAYHRQYYIQHREELSQRSKDYQKTHRKELNELSRRWRQQAKKEALTYYGGGTLACVRCGFTDIRALSIDHINGGGFQHFKEIGTRHLAEWLRRRGYPKGYQTLCMNCQFIKRTIRKEYTRIKYA